jgi:predicted flap endonuclease-1-like 5' DNA nuclease
LVVGFLVGMIPAMLLVGFLGGRQVEKQRKELKLQYDRQIAALRATIRRLMQRIDMLSGERSQLKRSNRNLREALREQHQYTDDTSAELLQLKDELTRVKNENLRHEGRLEQARLQQEQMEAQFSQTVAQFTQAERLRKHLIFAADQLRMAQISQQSGSQTTSATAAAEMESMADHDVAVLESIEPIYVERLHDSGIHTIADLAQQTPARLAHFAGLPSWDESTQWIAEANALLAMPPQSGA